MALVVKDRVRETSTTTGTGTFTLAGAVTGYQAFSAVGDGNTTYYTIYLQGGNEWEVGIGTYTASGTTLSRDTILASSNAGSAVNFSAGTKDVFVTYPAGRSVWYDSATNVTLNALTLSGGTQNGVLYLNASRVATSGSALTFDGNTLGVSTAVTALTLNRTGVGTALIELKTNGTIGSYLGTEAANNFTIYNAAGGQLATLNATGLGIGTNNPGQKLDVNGSGLFTVSGANQSILLNTSNNAQNYNGLINFQRQGSVKFYAALDANDSLAFLNSSAVNLLTITSSGNLGLGVTPSAWSGYTALQVGSGFSAWSSGVANARINANTYYNGGYKYVGTGTATMYEQDGYHAWYNAPSGTANSASVTSGASYTVVALGSSTLNQWKDFFNDSSNNPLTVTPTLGQVLTGNATGTLLGGGLVTQTISFTQAMTLDALGNLLVGTTSATYNASGRGVIELNGSSDNIFAMKVAGAQNFYVQSNATNTAVWNVANTYMSFGTNNTERARITSGASGGYFKASFDGSYIDATGTYHEFTGTTANGYTLRVRCTNATPANHYISDFRFTAASPNNATAVFIECRDSTAARFELRSDGGLANYQANDANLSDQRVKKDIVAAPSYWDKIKGIEIVHFKYKDQTHDDNNVGVIAQQVEQVAPEFVDQNGWGDTPEDGVPLKSIYTSDMHHAAIKALQEAMARIEKLEAEVAALKGA